jgi:hypothetical protein
MAETPEVTGVGKVTVHYINMAPTVEVVLQVGR